MIFCPEVCVIAVAPRGICGGSARSEMPPVQLVRQWGMSRVCVGECHLLLVVLGVGVVNNKIFTGDRRAAAPTIA